MTEPHIISANNLLSDLRLEDFQYDEDGFVEPQADLFAIIRRQNQLFLLKEKRSYLCKEEFESHIKLHRAIWEMNGPVAGLPGDLATVLPLRSSTGRLFEVQIWENGRRPDVGSLDDMYLLGSSLAAFHSLSGQVLPIGKTRHAEPRNRFEKALSYRHYLERELGSDHYLIGMLYGNDFLASWEREQRETAIHGLLHGDPCPENSLIQRNRCLLLDLDDFSIGPLCSDLAWMITLSCATDLDASKKRYSFRENWALARFEALIQGYCSQSKLPDQELGNWLTASLVCASVDLFFHGDCKLEKRALIEECRRCFHLIRTRNDLER